MLERLPSSQNFHHSWGTSTNRTRKLSDRRFTSSLNRLWNGLQRSFPLAEIETRMETLPTDAYVIQMNNGH
jgi:hypothetical protein